MKVHQPSVNSLVAQHLLSQHIDSATQPRASRRPAGWTSWLATMFTWAPRKSGKGRGCLPIAMFLLGKPEIKWMMTTARIEWKALEKMEDKGT